MLYWDNWNNWQWSILALCSTPSQLPLLNFVLIIRNILGISHQYIDMSQVVLSLENFHHTTLFSCVLFPVAQWSVRLGVFDTCSANTDLPQVGANFLGARTHCALIMMGDPLIWRLLPLQITNHSWMVEKEMIEWIRVKDVSRWTWFQLITFYYFVIIAASTSKGRGCTPTCSLITV